MVDLFKGLLGFMKLSDEDDEDDFDEYEEKERRQPRRRSTYEEQPEPRREVREKKPATSFAASRQAEPRRASIVVEENDENEVAVTDLKKERFQRSSSSNSIVPLRSRSTSSTQPISEICIMKPTSFEDSQDVCDVLIQGRAAVINLEGLELMLSQRIMDFISGAVYSLNGRLHQVSGYIFIISPDSFDISGDYLNFIEQSGFEVPNLK